MRRTFLWLVFMMATLVAPAATAEPRRKTDLAGMYLCDGVNPDGSEYHGTVEIAALDDAFLVLWTLSDGASMVGVGIYSGGVLAVSYFPGVPAIAVYKVDGDGLVGEWTMGADGGVHPETLIKTVPESPQPPPHRLPTAGVQIL